MSRTSLTSATEQYMRARGWVGGDVERTFKFGDRVFKRDFLGWADTVWIKAVTLGEGPIPLRALGVQHTDHTNAAARLKKMKASPGLRAWLGQGGECWLIAWGPKGPQVTVVERKSP